jgi:hypothetical protein
MPKMASVCISISTVMSTKVHGKTIRKTIRDFKNIAMALNIKEIFFKEIEKAGEK